MSKPTVSIHTSTTGALSLVAFGETYQHRDTFRAAGYEWGAPKHPATWSISAADHKDLARLIVAASDAGIEVYQGNRTTVVTPAQVEQARKQLQAA